VASEDPTVSGCPARAYIGERGALVIRDRVEFATGSDRILRASEAVLNDLLSILQSSPDVTRVRIEGHTDDQGADSANIRLSRARAASVRRWLVTHGIAAERLEAWGCGELHRSSRRARVGRGRPTAASSSSSSSHAPPISCSASAA
jgi:outer membrane protein OmpA-like peptidoglycan-associated protein